MSSAGGHRQGDLSSDVEVYHLELRQFPHNVCRFNLTERELWTTVVARWAQEQWVEVGERKWSPHQAKLTVLQGPRLPLEQLSMGRGWRAAQRNSRDVTEQVLDAAREAAEREEAAAQESLLADSLGLELLALLGPGPVPLRRVWELAGERHLQRSLGECLVLAERAVRSLLRSHLVALVLDEDGEASSIGEVQAEASLASIDSWIGASTTDERESAPLWIRRA
jgi:hypothetical protein